MITRSKNHGLAAMLNRVCHRASRGALGSQSRLARRIYDYDAVLTQR